MELPECSSDQRDLRSLDQLLCDRSDRSNGPNQTRPGELRWRLRSASADTADLNHSSFHPYHHADSIFYNQKKVILNSFAIWRFEIPLLTWNFAGGWLQIGVAASVFGC